jgi:hypothetical protein
MSTADITAIAQFNITHIYIPKERLIFYVMYIIVQAYNNLKNKRYDSGSWSE